MEMRWCDMARLSVLWRGEPEMMYSSMWRGNIWGRAKAVVTYKCSHCSHCSHLEDLEMVYSSMWSGNIWGAGNSSARDGRDGTDGTDGSVDQQPHVAWEHLRAGESSDGG